MSKFQTHYDNLKVTRNAPDEVIRASYKALSQKYHPDKNGGSSEAAQLMSSINASYQVLSDTKKRKEHDLWIEKNEQIVGSKSFSFTQLSSEPTESHHDAYKNKNKKTGKKTNIYKFCCAITLKLLLPGIILLCANKFYFDFAQGAKAIATSKTQMKSEVVHVLDEFNNLERSPNGNIWPLHAGYISGLPVLNNTGHSNIRVENQKDSSDVYAQLVSLDAVKPMPVRSFFIPKASFFALRNVSSGNYDIRYRDLITGEFMRTEMFRINEYEKNYGKKVTETTVTLR